MGKHFAIFAINCDTLRFISISLNLPKPSLFVGIPAFFRRFPLFMYVELEGVEHEKWDTVCLGRLLLVY